MDLKSLARSRGTNLKRVAEECGIPPTTLYAISRGDTNFDNVGIGTAIKVAGALDMSVEELYTGKPTVTYTAISLSGYGDVEPNGSKSGDPPPNDEERELLKLYRNLPPKGRRAVMAGLRDFAGKQ